MAVAWRRCVVGLDEDLKGAESGKHESKGKIVNGRHYLIHRACAHPCRRRLSPGKDNGDKG